MKTKLTRWLAPLLAIMAIFLFITPVLAIEQPDTLEINAVYVYQNCRETGDQMYIIDFTIEYTTPPAQNAYQAYMCRLREDTDVLVYERPYPFHENGYAQGVRGIYLSAEDAPDWEGSYNIQLIGNPFLDWTGGVPEDSVSTFDLWQDNEIAVTKVVLASRILTLAQALETDWGMDMVNVSDAGQLVLTSNGVAYFSAAIPYFTDVAPSSLPSGVIHGEILDPVIDDVDTSADYADSLEADIEDTLFDITPMADAFGVDRGPLTALLYYGVAVFALIVISRRIESTKPLMILAIPIVIGGAFVGVPLIATILVGFLALAYISYTIFYKPSSV